MSELIDLRTLKVGQQIGIKWENVCYGHPVQGQAGIIKGINFSRKMVDICFQNGECYSASQEFLKRI